MLHIALHDAAGDVAYERNIAADFSMRCDVVELNIPSQDDNNDPRTNSDGSLVDFNGP